MDDKKIGTLLVTLKKSEILVIRDGDDVIEITLTDKFKQPLSGRIRIRSSKRFDIKRQSNGGTQS